MNGLLERVLLAAESRRIEWERLARLVGSVSQQVAELRGRIEAHQRILEQLVNEGGARTVQLTNMAANVVELHRQVLVALAAAARPVEVEVDVSDCIEHKGGG